MKKKTKKTLLLFIAIIIAMFYNIISEPTNPSQSVTPDENVIVNSSLNIYYFDVGQADSIFIQNGDKNMLIDAGNNADGPLLVEYLKNKLKIKDIDIVVGTHPHEDHIGGLDNIIDEFNIKDIYMPEVITTSKTFEDVLTSIENKELSITVPEIDNEFKLGELIFKVLYTGTDETDLNNTSIVLKMTHGNINYLFTGDATDKVEKIILNKDIKADVLKVGHHGSSYSSKDYFLKKVKPKYAIISCAKENTYNHPSPETVTRLNNIGADIYQTSEVGTILLTSDGNNINIQNIKTNTNG